MLKAWILGLVSLVTTWFRTPVTAPIVPYTPPAPASVVNTQEKLPTEHIIPRRLHVFQTFNNCGPASLSMLLSYFGHNVSQRELGNSLRPYRHPTGDNDDKLVTLEELAIEGAKYDLTAYHRPNGSPELLKQFIAADVPVIVRTWLKPNEDIGHYRVIRGYDEANQRFIQDDSLQGKDLWYTFADLDEIWEPFNYEYLVLVRPEQQALAERILGENVDSEIAWRNTLSRLENNPVDIYDFFNLSVASYHTKDFVKSVEYFERIEQQLPNRMLWYQIEPIQAYYELGNYDRVLSLINNILGNNNRAFAELYYLRGQVYLKQGNRDQARREFEQAVQYNKNYIDATQALQAL